MNSRPDLTLYDLVKAVEEQSENEEFEDDELDLSQPVAELGEAVGIAAHQHKSPSRPKEIRGSKVLLSSSSP